MWIRNIPGMRQFQATEYDLFQATEYDLSLDLKKMFLTSLSEKQTRPPAVLSLLEGRVTRRAA